MLYIDKSYVLVSKLGVGAWLQKFQLPVFDF